MGAGSETLTRAMRKAIDVPHAIIDSLEFHGNRLDPQQAPLRNSNGQ
jgi:hypothetical protein